MQVEIDVGELDIWHGDKKPITLRFVNDDGTTPDLTGLQEALVTFDKLDGSFLVYKLSAEQITLTSGPQAIIQIPSSIVGPDSASLKDGTEQDFEVVLTLANGDIETIIFKGQLNVFKRKGES